LSAPGFNGSELVGEKVRAMIARKFFRKAGRLDCFSFWRWL